MYPVMRRFLTLRRTILMIVLLFAAGTAIIALRKRGDPENESAMAQTKPVLVIDAGHGGLDGGAVSGSGDRESEINLSIAQRLYDLCRLLGRESVMTRSSETLDYPPDAVSVREKKVWDQKRRAELINALPDAVLISIHQNLYPDARPSGTQVLYSGADGSEALAELTHEALRQHLCPENRRVASPASDSIYLLKSIRCPAVLVECGFLSNPDEAQKLTEASYQKKIASILCASYLQYCFPAI